MGTRTKLLSALLIAGLVGCRQEAPSPAAPASRPATAYVGNRGRGVVHKSDCRYVARMLPANRLPFARLDNALAEGFRPCSYCLPRSAATRPAERKGFPR